MTGTMQRLRAIAEYFSGQSVEISEYYGVFGTSSADMAQSAPEAAASAAPGIGVAAAAEVSPVRAAQELLERTRQRTLVPAPGQGLRAGLSSGGSAAADALMPLAPGQAESLRALGFAAGGISSEELTPEGLSRAFARDARRYDD